MFKKLFIALMLVGSSCVAKNDNHFLKVIKADANKNALYNSFTVAEKEELNKFLADLDVLTVKFEADSNALAEKYKGAIKLFEKLFGAEVNALVQ